MKDKFEEAMAQGIEFTTKSLGSHSFYCPKCGPTRKKKNTKSLYTTIEEDVILWKCMHCEWTGSAGSSYKKKTRSADSNKREYKKPDLTGQTDRYTKNLPMDCLEYLKGRGISHETAVKAELFWEKTGNLCFPFFEAEPDSKGGYLKKLVNIKHRGLSTKTMRQEKDAKQIFYGHYEVVKGNFAELVIVEGEFDRLSFNELGYWNVVSVPAGAPNKEVEDLDSPKFAFLNHAKDLISKMNRVIIAVDNDGPGKILKNELVKRIGKEKCWIVQWPDGQKDANDVLVNLGSDVFLEVFNEAQPCPVKGLFRVDQFQDDMLNYFNMDVKGGESTGYENLDNYYTIEPGETTIVTGIPNSGKSEVLDAMTVNLAKHSNWRFAIFSPENTKEQHVGKLVEKVVGRSISPKEDDRMTEGEFIQGMEWVNNRYFFLICDDDKDLPTLDWILDKARTAIMQYGVRGLIIDPYNEIEHEIPKGVNETHYISKFISRIKKFAKTYNIHIWIVAHPAKLQKNKDGEIMLPTPYDISGCYSEDTEVLTKRGWVLHRELLEDDLPLCFNPKTGTLRYLPYISMTSAPYEGKMHHYSGYSTDLLVTPNHRMVLQAHWKRPGKKEGNEHKGRPDTWSHDGWQFAKSEDLKEAKYWMPLAGVYIPPSGTNRKATQERKRNFEAIFSILGSTRNNGIKRFCVSNSTLADALQQTAIELGHYSTVFKKGNSYGVNIGVPGRDKRVLVLPRNREEVDYKGYVYCLTVPTGAYVTRRNGVMAICGNSANWVNKADNILIVHRAATKNVTEVHVAKVRNKFTGRQGACTLIWNRIGGTYSVPTGEDKDISKAKRQSSKNWEDLDDEEEMIAY